MAEPKTKPTKQSAEAFLKTIEPKQKHDDSLALLEMFTQATGEKPVMWGTSIVGFGVYVIKSGKKENEWPLVAFSPRKQNLTLYILSGYKDDALFGKLGTYKVSGTCLYINKLADIERTVLATLIKRSFQYHKKKLL